jgi:succinyl-CoA synthetase alpha subunit
VGCLGPDHVGVVGARRHVSRFEGDKENITKQGKVSLVGKGTGLTQKSYSNLTRLNKRITIRCGTDTPSPKPVTGLSYRYVTLTLMNKKKKKSLS